MSPINDNNKSFWKSIKDYIQRLFDLHLDKAAEDETIDEIKRSVEFKGANLWILMFAILICAIGLNMNSTAVIIGAMLISPLMGPIMGIGLGIGINDFNLIIKAFKNLGIAVGISVLVSAVYFAISPLNDVQSELLARTAPTLWDVLIGLFGGLAGIIAGSRKEKSNAIPGVAIATALMPPLCTAGFGIATGNWNFFFGAFYLFFINSVFIALSTYLIVRALNFKLTVFESPLQKTKVKRYIFVFVLLTIIPSVYTAVRVVRKSLFEQRASNFVKNEFDFSNCKVIERDFTYNNGDSRIEITLFGEKIDSSVISSKHRKLKSFGLEGTQLKVYQGVDEVGIQLSEVQKLNQNLRSEIFKDLFKESKDAVETKDEQIKVLEDELYKLKSKGFPVADISSELKAQHKNVTEFSISSTILSNTDSMQQDSVVLAYVKFKKRPSKSELLRMENWLKVRTKTEKLKLILN